MKHTRWLWILLILLLAAGILIPVSPRYRPVPSDDPSVYLYVGSTILHGGVPYINAWDHKQPLAFLVYAASLLLTPHSLWGIWLLELVGLMVTGLLGFLLLERITPRPVAFGAVSAALLTLSVVLWGYSLEELSLPLQILALYAFVRIQTALNPRGRIGWGLVAGAATGVSFFFKQSLIAAGAVVGLYLVLEMALRRKWHNITALGGMAAGFALVAAPIFVYLWRAGALTEYRNAVFGFNLAYAGLGLLERVNALLDALEFMSGTPGLFLAFALWGICAVLALLQAGKTLAMMLCARAFRPVTLAAGAGLAGLSLFIEAAGIGEAGFGLLQWTMLLIGAVLLLFGLLASHQRGRAWLADRLAAAPLLVNTESEADQLRLDLLWLCVLFFPILLFMVTLSGRNYVYYFIPLVLFLMLGVGLVGGIAAGSLTEPRTRRMGAVVLFGVGLTLAYNPVVLLLSQYRSPANPPLPKIVSYVYDHTTKADTILVWGKFITYAYFLTDRQAPTRYFYQAPVDQDSYNARFHVSDEILRDIQAHPPRLFMIYTEEKQPPVQGTCPLPATGDANSPGEIFQFICSRYHYAVTLDEFQVYQLQE